MRIKAIVAIAESTTRTNLVFAKSSHHTQQILYPVTDFPMENYCQTDSNSSSLLVSCMSFISERVFESIQKWPLIR